MINSQETFPVIYCMKNKGQPGLVKIGYTTDIYNRLKQLNSSTGLAYPFEVCFVYEVEKDKADKFVHNIIDLLNYSLRTKQQTGCKVRVREFFRMSEEQAYYLFEQIALLTDTDEKLHRTSPEGCYWDSRNDTSTCYLCDEF